MDPDFDGDLSVDVLVIGAGIQGLSIAAELVGTYSVCVVSDPAVAATTLDSSGYFSAGYDGTDVNRIQPARRAAEWWRSWADDNGLAVNPEPPWYVVPEGRAPGRTTLWADAMLSAPAAEGLPEVFADGSLADDAAFRAEADVVIDPGAVLARLRAGIEGRCLEGEVLRFGLAHDEAVDHVQLQVGDDVLPIVPRFVVLAAGVGNADLLAKVAARFADQAKRKASKALADGSQAVRAQHVIAVRGDLPQIDGQFDELLVTSHALDGSDDRLWLIEPPIDDEQTVAGSDNLRFERPIDPAIVRRAVEQLLSMSPTIEKRAADLRWSTYVARRTQHPTLAGPGAHAVAQPVPAKLEKFGLEAFLAVWPSHLAYAQFVGEAVAKRVVDALGPAQDVGGPAPADLGGPPSPPPRARWNRDDFPWQPWPDFAATYGLDGT